MTAREILEAEQLARAVHEAREQMMEHLRRFNFGTDEALLMPPGYAVELLEPRTSEAFDRAIAECDEQLAKMILGSECTGLTPAPAPMATREDLGLPKKG